MKERLKLVESFSELRAGMIVVIKDCPDCERTERGILLSLDVCDDDEYPEDIGSVGWHIKPRCPYDDIAGSESLIGEAAVADRNVFRVDDGLEDTGQTSVAVASKRKARV